MGAKLTSTYDLVEQIQYLYVLVVRAKDLPRKDVNGSCDPYVEVRIGNDEKTTRHSEKKSNPEWNKVFAFSKDRIQASFLEVTVKDKDFVKDDFIGRVLFDLNEIPKMVPPDSPLAPQWYRLDDKKNEKLKGELLLAVWWGSQADKAFKKARQSDAAAVGGADVLASIRSTVYLSPKLWYLRVNVIEAQDLQPSDRSRFPEVYVKAFLQSEVRTTRSFFMSKSINPMWIQDLMFVAAEPFEEPLILNVIGRKKYKVIGTCAIPLQCVDRRSDHKPVNTRWYNLEKHVMIEGETKEVKFAGKIHLRICLEGEYHELDESTHYSSDFRPTAKQLGKSGIGVLELGILSAHGLTPMKAQKGGRASMNAYCVAKYGQKWVRTRTIVDSFTPKWNEQHTWEVFDPCTVITIGVFNNRQLQGRYIGENDFEIGKVRILLSTLETGSVYTHLYPLLVLHPYGVKKTGEIHLAVRFTSSSLVNMMSMYFQLLLLKMHYIQTPEVWQLNFTLPQAKQIVAMRLSRAEPPLRREVVESMHDANFDMLDANFDMWSMTKWDRKFVIWIMRKSREYLDVWGMRKSKGIYFHIMWVLSRLIAVGKWFHQICHWKNPITTVLIHILFIILVMYPKLILPTIFLYLLLIGVRNYWGRPRHPPYMGIRLCYPDAVDLDDLDEFETFPTSRPNDIVWTAVRIKTLVGNWARQGERLRLRLLLSWRDPRAGALFAIFCLVAAIVLWVTPFQVLVLLTGFYVLRHPRFRHKPPSVLLNFFLRLPARTD